MVEGVLPKPDRDRRPHLVDSKTGVSMLLDTGAAVSVFPRSNSDIRDQSSHLQAINGTKIDTFGTKIIPVTINNKTFSQKFIVGQVQSPVLGWNFLLDHKLDIRWSNGQCFVQGQGTKAKLKMAHVSEEILSLKHMSFHDYAKANNTESPTPPIPSDYNRPFF